MGIESNHPLFDEWLAAQAEANSAERALMHAQIDHVLACGPPITREALVEVQRLRDQSAFLLAAALAEMEQRKR
jgi:hypothetical protein